MTDKIVDLESQLNTVTDNRKKVEGHPRTRGSCQPRVEAANAGNIQHNRPDGIEKYHR